MNFPSLYFWVLSKASSCTTESRGVHQRQGGCCSKILSPDLFCWTLGPLPGHELRLIATGTLENRESSGNPSRSKSSIHNTDRKSLAFGNPSEDLNLQVIQQRGTKSPDRLTSNSRRGEATSSKLSRDYVSKTFYFAVPAPTPYLHSRISSPRDTCTPHNICPVRGASPSSSFVAPLARRTRSPRC